ncbi:MAG: T9SS type A sorting domain-containing protein [Bacteroidales bacterium]|nr:T9SS type A sorting domain-containing protein [Bacteroidales bacterium]
MKKSTYLFMLIVMVVAGTLHGQDTAMDFDQKDCSGIQHHLFSELDAGKVVIIEFIMLNCAPCIVATRALEDIIKPYETSHPGRVVIYSFGYLNVYTCPQLTAWVQNNTFNHPIFSSGEAMMNYYGGMGMPTFVIVGSNEHKVYYKGIGYTSAQDIMIKNAIDQALLYNPTGMAEDSEHAFSIYPSVFSDYLIVETGPGRHSYEIVLSDLAGRQVFRAPLADNGRSDLSVAGLPQGMYIARLQYGSGIYGGVKLIRR